MRHLFHIGNLIALILLPNNGYAQDASVSREYNDHEIMVQLASAKTVDVRLNNQAQIDISLPSGWQKSVKDNTSVAFRVPYHTGVWGRIELLESESTVPDDIGEMENVLHTSLETVETQPLETQYMSGTESVLSGRSGGDMWQFILFSGTLKNGRTIRFYAMCPQRWFPAYRLFFEDIIRSVVYPYDSRHR